MQILAPRRSCRSSLLGGQSGAKWIVVSAVELSSITKAWFVTAGHMLKQIATLNQQVTHSKPGGRKKRDWVTDYATIMGVTQASLSKAFVHDELDIGVGKLKGYTTPSGYKFPQFRVREVEQGELLCRIGYPFIDSIRPTWSREKGFSFTNLFPVPMFANEALVSRFAKLNTGKWIETSSPGLKGQSGGPLVDSDGYICGIQVNTGHYPLGF